MTWRGLWAPLTPHSVWFIMMTCWRPSFALSRGPGWLRRGRQNPAWCSSNLRIGAGHTLFLHDMLSKHIRTHKRANEWLPSPAAWKAPFGVWRRGDERQMAEIHGGTLAGRLSALALLEASAAALAAQRESMLVAMAAVSASPCSGKAAGWLANQVRNPTFESGPDQWFPYGLGFAVSPAQSRPGVQSVLSAVVHSAAESEGAGAMQVRPVTLRPPARVSPCSGSACAYHGAGALGLPLWVSPSTECRCASASGSAGQLGRAIQRYSKNGGVAAAAQVVQLHQTVAAPLLVRGWSRAANVSGTSDGGYSVYVDINFADASHEWGWALPFDTGTHDWQMRSRHLQRNKPIATLDLYAMFRGHSGQAWHAHGLHLAVLACTLHGLISHPLAAARFPARLCHRKACWQVGQRTHVAGSTTCRCRQRRQRPAPALRATPSRLGRRSHASAAPPTKCASLARRTTPRDRVRAGRHHGGSIRCSTSHEVLCRQCATRSTAVKAINLILSHLHEFCNAHSDQQAAPVLKKSSSDADAARITVALPPPPPPPLQRPPAVDNHRSGIFGASPVVLAIN